MHFEQLGEDWSHCTLPCSVRFIIALAELWMWTSTLIRARLHWTQPLRDLEWLRLDGIDKERQMIKGRTTRQREGIRQLREDDLLPPCTSFTNESLGRHIYQH